MFTDVSRPLHVPLFLSRRCSVYEIILYYFLCKTVVSLRTAFDKALFSCYTFYAFTCAQDRATQRCDPSGVQGLAERVVHIASLFFVAGLPLSLENKSDKPRGLGQRPKSRRLHFHLVFDIFLYNCYAYRYWYDNNVKEIKFYGTAKSIRRD